MKTPLFAAAFVLAFGLVVAGCGQKAAKAKPDEGTAAGGNPATAPLDYLAAQGKAKQAAVKVTSTAELTSAIQKFYAIEDRYPRDLNELVAQRYLQALPPTPNGTRLAYNPQTGDVKFVAAGTPAPAGVVPTAPGAQPAPARPAQRLPGLPGLKTQPQQQRAPVPE